MVVASHNILSRNRMMSVLPSAPFTTDDMMVALGDLHIGFAGGTREYRRSPSFPTRFQVIQLLRVIGCISQGGLWYLREEAV